MANIGHFDAEIRPLAWFDATAVAEGWWDYGMPFQHDLISDAVVVGARQQTLTLFGVGA